MISCVEFTLWSVKIYIFNKPITLWTPSDGINHRTLAHKFLGWVRSSTILPQKCQKQRKNRKKKKKTIRKERNGSCLSTSPRCESPSGPLVSGLAMMIRTPGRIWKIRCKNKESKQSPCFLLHSDSCRNTAPQIEAAVYVKNTLHFTVGSHHRLLKLLGHKIHKTTL